MINFDRVADIYDETRGLPPGMDERIMEAIVAATHAEPDTRFLELGIGTGRVALPFVRHGYAYTGVDISEQMMNVLRDKVGPEARNLELITGDVAHLPQADGSVDVVLAVHLLHLVPNVRVVLQEVQRVLAPMGHLVVAGNDTVPDDPRREIQGQWREFVQQAGVELPSNERGQTPGQTELWEMGAQTTVFHVGSWARPFRPADLLQEQRDRVFSLSWSVPDDVLEQVDHQMQDWVNTRYGSADVELETRQEFLLSVSQFPQE